PILIDFAAAVLRVSVTDATLSVAEFVYLRGGFAFEKGTAIQATDTLGTTKEVDVITIGASNVYAFAGVGGPYWVDSNDDGRIDNTDTPDAGGAMGIALANVAFGLALLRPTNLSDAVSYLSLKISADSAELVGLGDLLSITARGITVE